MTAYLTGYLYAPAHYMLACAVSQVSVIFINLSEVLYYYGCTYTGFPQNIMINTTDTSVLITWQPPGVTWPDHYNITLAYTKNSQFSNQSHTSTIQVLGSDTRMEYDRLVPQQNYSCCISSIYGSQLSSSCLTFKTEVLGSVSGSNKSATAIGILCFMTVLLVLLLVLVGVGGLTYPRCLRLRIKDRKYLSR